LDSSFSSFFWLDPKEPKGQDLPKLPPHEAERWPAGKSSHRAYPINIGCYESETPTNFQILIVSNGQNTVISILYVRRIFKTQCYKQQL